MDAPPRRALIDLDGLEALIGALRDEGRRVIGPTVRDGAIVLDDVTGVADLPVGWVDEQSPGRYRVERNGNAVFGHAVGPGSPRRFLDPPRRTLWSATTDLRVVAPEVDEPALAFLGVRPCDLAAIAVQDRVEDRSPSPDPWYEAVRRAAVVVTVACTRPSASCFCASMGTGPRADAGFDLQLTELSADCGGPSFVVEVGTDAGGALLARIPSRDAVSAEVAAAERAVSDAAASMQRRLDPLRARDVLAANLEHPRWSDVALRCLSCTNCTLVCPTCFCHAAEDVTDVAGERAERQWRWSSCFELQHSFLHGGSVRDDTRSRYRQWLVHKLSTWWDQFDGSGCVGCGRCISWCPVGIDLTEEVAAIAGTGGS